MPIALGCALHWSDEVSLLSPMLQPWAPQHTFKEMGLGARTKGATLIQDLEPRALHCIQLSPLGPRSTIAFTHLDKDSLG